ncbi:hypothetical protein ACIQUB_31170 [Rhizobium sp. NPDC090275]|uniref:hypothetical protein n=1 Tax=Rhizobium sp. NPDC090275 TaxID=3364498 RepID=UPI00383A9F02
MKVPPAPTGTVTTSPGCSTSPAGGALEAANGVKRFAGLIVDPEARTISTEDGTAVPLTTTEFDLLACFLDSRSGCSRAISCLT